MMKIDLKSSFEKIYDHLIGNDQKPTNIAKQIGFTTTTQLQNVLSGKSQLSTQAIIGLIENLNVNPTFLFLGKGNMFLAEEDDLQKLQREYNELLLKHGRLGDDVYKLGMKAIELEENYKNLQEISATAIKYYKEKLKALGISEDKNSPESPVTP